MSVCVRAPFNQAVSIEKYNAELSGWLNEKDVEGSGFGPVMAISRPKSERTERNQKTFG